MKNLQLVVIIASQIAMTGQIIGACFSKSVVGSKCTTALDEKCKPTKVNVCTHLLPNSVSRQIEICGGPKKVSKKEVLKTNQICDFSGDIKSCCTLETLKGCYRLSEYDCDTVVITYDIFCQVGVESFGKFNDSKCYQNLVSTPTEDGDYTVTNTLCP